MTTALAAGILAWAAAGPSLFEQAAIRLLEERFPGGGTSWLLLDADSCAIRASRWGDADVPVAAGSLVKPFTAMAWEFRHGPWFPEFTCRGAASGCWRPRGHGRIGLIEAIAHSCNAYFDALSRDLNREDVALAARRFGLDPPPEGEEPGVWTGRAGLWRAAPVRLARAYASLAASPDAATVLRAMAESARNGTSRAAGSGLAKTGTAPCSHSPRAPGDGFVVLLEPADAPRYVLLVRVHGVPGAEAAAVAGEMLRTLREAR